MSEITHTGEPEAVPTYEKVSAASIGQIVLYCIKEDVWRPAIICETAEGLADLRLFAMPNDVPFAYGSRVHTDQYGAYVENAEYGNGIGNWR